MSRGDRTGVLWTYLRAGGAENGPKVTAAVQIHTELFWVELYPVSFVQQEPLCCQPRILLKNREFWNTLTLWYPGQFIIDQTDIDPSGVNVFVHVVASNPLHCVHCWIRDTLWKVGVRQTVQIFSQRTAFGHLQTMKSVFYCHLPWQSAGCAQAPRASTQKRVTAKFSFDLALIFLHLY